MQTLVPKLKKRTIHAKCHIYTYIYIYFTSHVQKIALLLQKGGKKLTMADTFVIQPRNVSSRLTLLFLEALLLRKAAQTPMHTGKHTESLRSWERSRSRMDFFAISFMVDISKVALHSVCLPQWSRWLYKTAIYCPCILMMWTVRAEKKREAINIIAKTTTTNKASVEWWTSVEIFIPVTEREGQFLSYLDVADVSSKKICITTISFVIALCR